MSNLISAAVFLLALFAAYILVPAYLKYKQIRHLSSVCERKGILVLTYDDGPGSVVTQGVLDILRRYDANATFFVLGKRAAEHPELLDRIAEGGHEIGSHGYAHQNAWTASPWSVLDDIGRGLAMLDRKFAESRLFRPPNGKTTALTWLFLRKYRTRLAWWTHDSGDTWHELPDADKFVASVLLKEPMKKAQTTSR